MTEVRVDVNSNDRKYYTQVQRLVWAKCRNPYDLSLWIVIKNIAGDKAFAFCPAKTSPRSP